jgi:anaerobic selenocysteine-containing dehydrogenase
MNQQDAVQLNLVEDQLIDIQSIANDNIVRKVSGFSVVFYDIPRGNIAAYYPETNPLVSINSVGVGSSTPTSKSIPVIITPSSKQVINVALV